MNEEVRRRLRQLVIDGKITPEEARQLTEAMSPDSLVPISAVAPQREGARQERARFLTIRVSGRQTVNLRIPLALAKDAVPFILKYVPADQLPGDLNLDALASLIERAAAGTLLEVKTDQDHIVVGLE